MIKKFSSAWYHLVGEKTLHYLRANKMMFLCGDRIIDSLRLVSTNLAYADIHNSCSDCVTAYQKMKTGNGNPNMMFIPENTYYIPFTCSDCKADCVIVSSTPEPKKGIHVHLGCPASD